MPAHDTHQDTRKLADTLAAVPFGELISYDMLSAVIGRDARQYRPRISSAMGIASREHGAAFTPVRGKGYRRLTPDETPKIGQTTRKAIYRRAGRGWRAMQSALSAGVQYMSREEHRKTLTEISVAGALRQFSRDKNLPTLSEKAQRPLSVAASCKQFLERIRSAPSKPAKPAVVSPPNVQQPTVQRPHHTPFPTPPFPTAPFQINPFPNQPPQFPR